MKTKLICLIVGIIVGAFAMYHIPLTKIHGECERGDKDACTAESKISIYK